MMKIAYLQVGPILGDLDGTIEKISLRFPHAEPPELLVLPELCNSGYNFESMEQARDTSEIVEDSVFIHFLGELCCKYDMHIVSGFNERDSDVLYNSSVLIGPNGVIGTYRKMHLFYNEFDFFQPGNIGLPVFDIGICRVGMLVCFDWQFPEIWRILAMKGADVICHPSNLVLPGLAQRAVPIWALTNRVFTVTANRIGCERELTFTGLSTIASPKGEVLLQASETDEAVGVVEVDILQARDKQITARNHIFDDRRPDLYSELLA